MGQSKFSQKPEDIWVWGRWLFWVAVLGSCALEIVGDTTITDPLQLGKPVGAKYIHVESRNSLHVSWWPQPNRWPEQIKSKKETLIILNLIVGIDGIRLNNVQHHILAGTERKRERDDWAVARVA